MIFYYKLNKKKLEKMIKKMKFFEKNYYKLLQKVIKIFQYLILTQILEIKIYLEMIE